MRGGTAALFTRSLRSDARSLRMHLLRLGCAIIILGLHLYSQFAGPTVGAPGLAFFSELATLTAIFITLAGISYFATAITEDKEDGTLELLRVADVDPLSLLLGKSTARITNATLILAVQFPFTLFAVTLGGVTVHQILAAYCTLFAYMLLVANLALVPSVWCRRSSGATLFSAVLIGTISVGPFVLDAAIKAQSGSGLSAQIARGAQPVVDVLYQASIFSRLMAILATGYREPVFDIYVMVYLLVAALGFLVAWLTFDWVTQTHDASVPRRAFYGHKRWNRLIGVGRTWRYAFAWKDFHFVTGGTTWMMTKLIAYGLIVAGIALWTLSNRRYPRELVTEKFGETVVLAMLIALTVEICVYASWIFNEEMKGKTFSGICLLPISIARIAGGKLAGCLMSLIPALAYLLLFGALFAPHTLMKGFVVLFATSPGVAALLQFLVFLHLTALVSLFIRWGSLPLALAIGILVGTCVYAPFLAAGGMLGVLTDQDEWTFVPMNLLAIGLLVLFEAWILQRMLRLAGE